MLGVVTGVSWGQCEVDKMTGEPLDTLNLEAIKFCREVGSQATTVSEILDLRDPMVYAAIQKGINAVNQKAISNAQKIQKWVILEKDFSISGGELGEWPGEFQHLEAGPLMVSRALWVLRRHILFWESEGLWDQLPTKGWLHGGRWCPPPPDPTPSRCRL